MATQRNRVLNSPAQEKKKKRTHGQFKKKSGKAFLTLKHEVQKLVVYNMSL